jgi:hypothetical protein
MLRLSSNKQIGDFLPGGRIQIAGGFVREQHGRVRHEGARDGHSLLLAAGQLFRVVGRARRQAHLGQRLRPPCRASRRLPNSSGSMTFSTAVSEGMR